MVRAARVGRRVRSGYRSVERSDAIFLRNLSLSQFSLAAERQSLATPLKLGLDVASTLAVDSISDHGAYMI